MRGSQIRQEKKEKQEKVVGIFETELIVYVPSCLHSSCFLRVISSSLSTVINILTY